MPRPRSLTMNVCKINLYLDIMVEHIIDPNDMSCNVWHL